MEVSDQEKGGYDMSGEATIRVTGRGMLKLKPDVTRVMITLTGCYKEYEETLRRSSEDTESLKDVLEKLGFDRTDLKTTNFNVQVKNESYQAKDHSWKERFVGYEFYHSMKLEFDSDRERLGKILYALAHAEVQPELRLSYTVKDAEAAKNALLGAAVSDARAKAMVLAAASGVKLDGILRIDYSRSDPTFEVRPMAAGVYMAKNDGADMCRSYDMDIEPEDIEVEDVVTLVWRITGRGAAKE